MSNEVMKAKQNRNGTLCGRGRERKRETIVRKNVTARERENTCVTGRERAKSDCSQRYRGKVYVCVSLLSLVRCNSDDGRCDRN